MPRAAHPGKPGWVCQGQESWGSQSIPRVPSETCSLRAASELGRENQLLCQLRGFSRSLGTDSGLFACAMSILNIIIDLPWQARRLESAATGHVMGLRAGAEPVGSSQHCRRCSASSGLVDAASGSAGRREMLSDFWFPSCKKWERGSPP